VTVNPITNSLDQSLAKAW